MCAWICEVRNASKVEQKDKGKYMEMRICWFVTTNFMLEDEIQGFRLLNAPVNTSSPLNETNTKKFQIYPLISATKQRYEVFCFCF